MSRESNGMQLWNMYIAEDTRDEVPLEVFEQNSPRQQPKLARSVCVSFPREPSFVNSMYDVIET